MKQLVKTIQNPALWALAPLLLVGCATQPSLPAAGVIAPSAWTQSPPQPATAIELGVLVPHQGSVQGLAQWWAGLGDPYLLTLIDKAQAQSPSVEAAKTRMVAARASQVQAGAAGGPLAQGSVGLSRGINSMGDPVATGLIGSAQASWEIDLFGGIAANQAAARARLTGAEATWHDARVSVAAEVAHAYFALKACERVVAVTEQQLASVTESARLTQLLVQAGMVAPSQATALTVAQLQTQSGLAQARAQCKSARTGLIALTGESEAALVAATQGTSQQALTPPVALPAVPALPAQLLTQRPDVLAAQLEVAAASQDVGVANAQRYPRLSLNGSITGTRARASGTSADFLTWSIGPLAVSFPILDGGQRAAASEVAVAQYELAVSQYRAKVRQAVSEVEEALNQLSSTAEQSRLALAVVQQQLANQAAVAAKWDKGMASKADLEETRRQVLSAQTHVLNLERERVTAWISLYRALGGGWQATTTATHAANSTPTPQ